jgi:hypothetical protein
MLTAPRGNHEDDAVRLANEAIDRIANGLAHAERGEVEVCRVLVEQAQHDALARAGRQRRHADVDLLVAQLERDAAVLRQPLFRDVEIGHDLESRHQCGVQRARRLDHVAQHAVDAEAHDGARFIRLEVQVGRTLAQRLQQERVDHTDHRRLRGAVEQVLGDRHVLHQAREIGLAGQVVGERGRCRRRRLVVGARKLERERIGADRARHQGSLQYALDFDDAVRRGIRTREDDDGVTFHSRSQHAVRFRERVRDLRRERGGGGRDVRTCCHGGQPAS